MEDSATVTDFTTKKITINNFRFNLIEENPSHQLPTDLLGLLGLDPKAHFLLGPRGLLQRNLWA